MLQNFLSITLRRILRQPFHSLLNLSCLTIGIAATLLIALYLNFELTYDQFHVKSNRIYRIETETVSLRQKVIEADWPWTPNNLGALIKQYYPQVENVVRFFSFFKDNQITLEYLGQKIKEKDVYGVDPSVFDVFSFDLIVGDPKQALEGPNKIVLSENLAQRLFGKVDPLGKIIVSKLAHNLPGMAEQYSLVVTGVYRDLPNNTHLPLQALISAATDPGQKSYYFGMWNTFTYLLLPATTEAKKLAPQLTQIYKKYLDPTREPMMLHARHELRPLPDIHTQETGGLTYIYIFSAIGGLLLLIAVISYVNLVTAQASKRTTEIGIRKVLGSHRQQLIQQFLSESLLLTLLSLFFAILLVMWFIAPLNQLLGLQLWVGQLGQAPLLASMLGIFIVIGLLGGSYPAFFLASFEPIEAIKGKVVKGAPFRRLLVAVQFGAVIFVLSCTSMIYRQLEYIRKKDLGFDKEHIIRLTLSGDRELQHLAALKNQLLQSPYIAAVGTSDFRPGADDMPQWPISAFGSADKTPQMIHRGYVDYNFFSTMNMPVLQGRNYSKDFPADVSTTVIVNETFLRSFGLKKSVGEKVLFRDATLEIIGIVKDFNQSTLHSPVAPQIFLLSTSSPHVYIKVKNDLRAAIQHLEKSWDQLLPTTPLDYRFLEEELNDGYKRDIIRGRIFLSFSLLTLFISFLGLFGLASYIASSRVKEVSIRKVLGATISQLVLLLTKDFLLLVCLAALPAFALARYIIKRWLENFAYRTEIDYALLGLILAFTLLLTFFTTGWHALRAARLSPAHTLKQE